MSRNGLYSRKGLHLCSFLSDWAPLVQLFAWHRIEVSDSDVSGYIRSLRTKFACVIPRYPPARPPSPPPGFYPSLGPSGGADGYVRIAGSRAVCSD